MAVNLDPLAPDPDPPVPLAPETAPGVIPPPNSYAMPAPPPDDVAPADLVATQLPDSARYAADAARAQIARDDAGAPSTQPPGVDPATGAPLPAPPPAAAAPAAPGRPRRAGAAAPTGPSAQDQALGQYDTAASDEAKAAVEAGKAAADAATARADALDKKAKDSETRAADQERWEAAQDLARGRYQAIADQADRDVANFKYKDFWETQGTGKQALTMVGVFLMGLGGGIPGVEAANRQINAAIANDMQLQKANLAKKETLAEAKRQGVKDFDAWRRDRRASLELKEAALRNAAADEVEAMAARGGAKVDQANATKLAATLRKDAIAGRASVEKTFVQTDTERAHASLLRAEASKARAAAHAIGGGPGSKADQADEKLMLQQTKGEEARLLGTPGRPGIVTQQRAVRELGNELRDAIASNDPARVNSALVAVKEKIARLNTGAAPSHAQMQLLEQLTGDPQRAGEKIARLLGDPKASQQTLGSITALVDQSDENLTKQVDQAYQGMAGKYLGPGGLAHTETRKRVANDAMRNIFGQATTRTPQGEVPRYQIDGVPAAPAAPPPPARSFSAHDDEALAWAKANPQDPRAARIHQLQGR